MTGYIPGEDLGHAGVGKNAGVKVIAQPEENNSRSSSEI